MPAYHEILGPYRECTDILFQQYKQLSKNQKEIQSNEFQMGAFLWKLVVLQCENGDISVHLQFNGRNLRPALREGQLNVNVQDVRYVDLGVCVVAPLKTPQMMTLFGNDLKLTSKKWGWAKFLDKQSLFGDSKQEGWLGPHDSLRFRVWVNYRPEEVPKKFTEFEEDVGSQLVGSNSSRSMTSISSSEAESRVYLAHTARIVWDLLINVNVRKNPSYKLNQNKIFKGSCVETMFQLLCHMHNEEYEIKALWDVYGLAEVATKFHCRVKIHNKICQYIEQHQGDMLLGGEDIGDPCHVVQILELADKHNWKSIVGLCEWKIYKYGQNLFQQSHIINIIPTKSKDRILYVLYSQITKAKNTLALSRVEFVQVSQTII